MDTNLQRGREIGAIGCNLSMGRGVDRETVEVNATHDAAVQTWLYTGALYSLQAAQALMVCHQGGQSSEVPMSLKTTTTVLVLVY